MDLSLTGDDGALLEPLGSILLESLRNELSEDLLVAPEPVLFFVQATPAKGLIIWTAPKLGDSELFTNTLTLVSSDFLSFLREPSEYWKSFY